MGIVTELESTRKIHGLTQAELAARAGLSRMTVQRTEAGFDPRLSTLQEMARAMGLELMLVPRLLRPEVESFVQSGGRMVGQVPGSGAPRSVVDLLAVDAAAIDQDMSVHLVHKEKTEASAGRAIDAVDGLPDAAPRD